MRDKYTEMYVQPPHLAHLAQAAHSDRKWIRGLLSSMRTSPLRISIICTYTDLKEIEAEEPAVRGTQKNRTQTAISLHTHTKHVICDNSV